MLGAGDEATHAIGPDQQHRRTRRKEADRAMGLAFLHQAERARRRITQQRADKGAGRGLHCLGQARQPLDHQRGADRAEVGIETDIEEAAFGEVAVQRLAAEGKARLMQRRAGIGPGQRVDRVENRDLVVGQGQVHQRGSRGSLSTSLAMMLSWISAAPAAMPATIPR